VLCEYAKFLGVFLRAPALTSSVVPSSRWLAARMLEGMQLEQAKVVVELGAGTGAFTRAIEQRLHPEALFLAVEINPLFAAHLTEKFPRAQIIHGSAEQLHQHLSQFGHTVADCVLSGLPWAGFPLEVQQEILAAVHRTLRPGGQLVTFAYNHMAWMPGGRRFRRLLEANFSRVIATEMVWRNLPPAFVYRCEK
jgi:phospholipid N-methyltransferase